MRSIDITDTRELLIKWLKRCHINIQTHYRSANRYRGFHYWIGVPLVIATVVLGSELFELVLAEPHAKIATVILGVVATLFAAFQTLFKFEERRNGHILAAQRYGEIARRIERILSGTLSSSPEELDKIEDQINKAVRDSTLPPSKIFKQEDDAARDYYSNKKPSVQSTVE